MLDPDPFCDAQPADLRSVVVALRDVADRRRLGDVRSASPRLPLERCRAGTVPILALVGSEDVSHSGRLGGHIGLIAGLAARKQIRPELTA
jgi:hypothetical protein